jgi:hypothetical protein
MALPTAENLQVAVVRELKSGIRAQSAPGVLG